MKKVFAVIKAAAMGGAVKAVVDQMSDLGVSRYTIESGKLPKAFDGLKIAHLSDLHNKKYGNGDIDLYRLIDREKPDIVVMTGDMISHDAPNKEDFMQLVERLCMKYPVFYVNGNHERSDMSESDYRCVAKRFYKAGARCIDNAYVNLYKGDSVVKLCGLCYSAKFYRGVRQYKFNWNKFTLEDMVHYCGKKPSEDYTILLAHNPLDFDVHAEWGADLSFGGHIHGGFIRLPVVKGIISPELKLFPKYKEGVYSKGKSQLVVSRGLGRIRFFNPPELVVVTLKSK